MEVDLTGYKSIYKRKSDGREFLGRQVVPGTCRMYDTVLKIFAEMGKSTVAKNFEKVGTNKGLKIKGKVKGYKVRELRKAGVKINHRPYEDLSEIDGFDNSFED